MATSLPRDPGKRERTQNGIPVVPTIDGLRWFAVVAVVAVHVWGASRYQAFRGTVLWAPLSATIVTFDLFFIVSGFVMFLPAAAREGRLGDLRSYAIRRIARIFPGYWASLIVVLACFPLLVAGHPSPFHRFGGAAIISHFSVLQTETLVFPSLLQRVTIGFGVNGSIWTLPVEVIFYASLPLIAMRFYRRPVMFLLFALAASAAFRFQASAIATGWLHLINYPATRSSVDAIANGMVIQFPAYLGDFAIGMFCAWAMVRLQRRPLANWQPRAALALMIVALILILTVVPPIGGNGLQDTRFHRNSALELLVPLMLGAFVLGTTLAPPRATRLLSNRLIGRLADMSYGTFLYHLPLVFFAMVTLGFPVNASAGSFLLLFAFALVGSSIMGWLSYTLIESPMRNRGQRLAKRLQSSARTSSAAAVPERIAPSMYPGQIAEASELAK